MLKHYLLNDHVLAKMKVWTKGKYLWLRTITSTIVFNHYTYPGVQFYFSAIG
jgi:hypothetical protein